MRKIGTWASERKNPTLNWRKLELWGRSHHHEDVRRLAAQAFEKHDIRAMNDLRSEYAWFLDRME